MSIDRKKLKTEARTILREAKPSPVFVTLAFLGIIAVLQALSMAMNGDFAAMEQTAANILRNKDFRRGVLCWEQADTSGKPAFFLCTGMLY